MLEKKKKWFYFSLSLIPISIFAASVIFIIISSKSTQKKSFELKIDQIKIKNLDKIDNKDQDNFIEKIIKNSKLENFIKKHNLKINNFKLETISSKNFYFEGESNYEYKIYYQNVNEKIYLNSQKGKEKFLTKIINKEKYFDRIKNIFNQNKEKMISEVVKKYFRSDYIKNLNWNEFVKTLKNNDYFNENIINQIFNKQKIYNETKDEWKIFKTNDQFFKLLKTTLNKKQNILNYEILLTSKNKNQAIEKLILNLDFNIEDLIKYGKISGIFTSREMLKKAIKNLKPNYKNERYIDLKRIEISDDVRFNFNDFNRIIWKDAINLNNLNSPFQGDISQKNLLFNWIGGLDMSNVTKWPDGNETTKTALRLRGYDNQTKIGSNLFKGDISDKKIIFEYEDKNLLPKNKIDVSKVTKWFKNEPNTKWYGFNGKLYKNLANNPFQGDLSQIELWYSSLANINLNQVTNKPKRFINVDFTNSHHASFAMLNGKIENSRIKIEGMDLRNIQSFKNTEVTGSNVKNIPDQLKLHFGVDTYFDSFTSSYDYFNKNGLFDKDPFEFNTVKKIIAKKHHFEKIFKNYHNSIFFGNYENWDVSKIDYSSLKTNGWVDFSNVKGYEKLGYKSIREWIKNEILPTVKETKISKFDSWTHHNSFDLKNNITKINYLKIGWKENGEYHFLYELLDLKPDFYGSLKGTFNNRDELKKAVININENSIKGDVIDLNNIHLEDNVKFNFNDLRNIKWLGVDNLNIKNTPFQGDISSKLIAGTDFYLVTVGKITKWPKDLSNVSFISKNIANNNDEVAYQFFQGDISSKIIKNVNMRNINLIDVSKWPKDLSGISWGGNLNVNSYGSNIFKGDMSSYNLNSSSLEDVNVTQITKWPINRYNINWKNVIYHGSRKIKPLHWPNDVWINVINNT